MRRGKMHILHLAHGLFEPVLPGDIRVLFLGRKGFCCHQAPIIVVDSNTAQVVSVGFIQKIHSPLDIHILIG